MTLPVLHPHPLCPVTAVCRAMHQSPLQSASAPAFPITGAVFDRKLKARVRSESGQITSHSFRRGEGGGGAVHALSSGLPGEVVKLFGDWESAAYLSYLDQLPQSILDYYRVLFAHNLPHT